ncbi:NAC domain-containing protein [Phycomyces nitens]|nr:NAC domain-containing protein [Phycomyces nitens]
MSAKVEEKPVEQIEEIVEEFEETVVDSPHSRGEKKARKAILGLGLKRVAGINRVTFTRGRDTVYAIAKPEVYQSMNSDTFIVFGEMQVEDLAARAQAAAAEQLAAEAAAGVSETAPEAAAVEEEEEEEEAVDETGVNAEDIELIITQAKVSRSKAVKALKNNNNDIVNAIMELTM